MTSELLQQLENRVATLEQKLQQIANNCYLSGTCELCGQIILPNQKALTVFRKPKYHLGCPS